MNLKELIEEINSALDYNPDLEAYKSQVSRVVNRHYLQISSQYPWLFRQKAAAFTLRADIKGEAGKKEIQVGEDDHYDASNVLHFKGTDEALINPEMLGNTLVINGNSTITSMESFSHGSSEREFTITGIFDGKSEAGGATGHTGPARHGGMVGAEFPDGYQPSVNCGIVIDRPLIDPSARTLTETTAVVDDITNPEDGKNTTTITNISITKSSYTDWSIEFRKYLLPEDCVEVLGIVDRGLKSTVHKETSGTVSTSTNTAPDRGRLIFIDSAKEEQLYLDRDSSGDPVVGIEGMPTYVTPPQDAPAIVAYENFGNTHIGSLQIKGSDGTAVAPFGLMQDPQILADEEYEYCYTFVYGGVESPPSPVCRLSKGSSKSSPFRWVVIQTEMTEGTFRRNNTYGKVVPYFFDDLTESLLWSADTDLETKTRFTGRMKRIYRRKVPTSEHSSENIYGTSTLSGSSFKSKKLKSSVIGNVAQGNGGWMHIGDTFDSHPVIDIGFKQTSFSAETSVTEFDMHHEYTGPTVLGWPSAYWMKKGFWSYHDGELQKVRRLDETGPRQSIRIYRPPSQDMDIEIRYLSRPKRLVANGDTPEWPPQYHHLLVYMALADVCLQHGMGVQAQLYEKKSEELLDRMKQKYLTRSNRKYVRRGFDRAMISGERFGNPTKV